jgi:hypothetical protein
VCLHEREACHRSMQELQHSDRTSGVSPVSCSSITHPATCLQALCLTSPDPVEPKRAQHDAVEKPDEIEPTALVVESLSAPATAAPSEVGLEEAAEQDQLSSVQTMALGNGVTLYTFTGKGVSEPTATHVPAALQMAADAQSSHGRVNSDQGAGGTGSTGSTGSTAVVKAPEAPAAAAAPAHAGLQHASAAPTALPAAVGAPSAHSGGATTAAAGPSSARAHSVAAPAASAPGGHSPHAGSTSSTAAAVALPQGLSREGSIAAGHAAPAVASRTHSHTDPSPSLASPAAAGAAALAGDSEEGEVPGSESRAALPLALAGLLSLPVVAWSELVLSTTGEASGTQEH